MTKSAGKPALSNSFRHSSRKPTPSKPFAFRVSDHERQLLAERAGDIPVSAYIRGVLFGNQPSTPGSIAKPDAPSPARILGLLGKSDIAKNLGLLAEACRSGRLTVKPELERALMIACDDIHALRSELILSLGLKDQSRGHDESAAK